MSHKTAEELGIHLPPPSFYPLLVSFGVMFIPLGIITRAYFENGLFDIAILQGGLMIWFGVFMVGFSLMGWSWEVIKDKNDAHTDGELTNQLNDLTLVTKLILVSEAAIFAALFVHYFYTKDFIEVGLSEVFKLTTMRPEGILETSLPAMATLILMFSSYTCHISHHALMHGDKAKSKTYIIITIILGTIFLGIQGWEWGHFSGLEQAFTSESGMFGTAFYMLTGFHGAHVALGLVLLFLVYARMEMNHMSEKRHFSMIAASWYWHFVDIIWIFLFFVIYLI